MWKTVSILLSACILLVSNYVYSQERQSANPVSLSESVLITLERVDDFECPICRPGSSYKLTISSDGSVVFEGRKHVKVVGTANSKITTAELQQLVSEFERIDYFSLRDTYLREKDGCPMYMSDQPFAYTSFQVSGRKKAIAHYYGCGDDDGKRWGIYPQELFNLEKKIDEVVNTKQWLE